MKLFRQALLAAFLILLTLGAASSCNAQEEGEQPMVSAPPKDLSIAEVIRRFATKEKEFQRAREQYTYRQSVKVQTLDGDTVDGEYQMVTDIDYDSQGRRMESVVFAPQSTLARVSMSREDFESIRSLMPFVLTSDDITAYRITYVGQQKVDELNTYVFDLGPSVMEKGKQYFEGRIWVDDHDLQIVKTSGKSVPEKRVDKKGKGEENLFPRFTTWREQIDGVYWFPTYTRADDVLHFQGGRNSVAQDVHIREIIKYTNYKKFGSNVKITYDGKEVIKGADGKAQLPQTGTSPPPATSKPPKQ